MSNVQKLKDVIAEYVKSNKHLDKVLNKARENKKQGQREREAEQTRPA